MPTVKEALNTAQSALRACSPTARLDAEILLAFVRGCQRYQLITQQEATLTDKQAERYRQLIARRLQHTPIAYLTNEKSFMGKSFYIVEDVLIPRPDTEILVEQASHLIADNHYRVLDLCTGSGIIAICLLLFCPNSTVSAVDISPTALRCARINARRHAVNGRLQLLQGDLYQPVQPCRFDVIVSNPPYINRADMAKLPRDIKRHESAIALDGGIDGLDFYRRIIGEAPNHLTAGGQLFLEIGYDQAAPVSQLMRDGGFTAEKVYRDLAGDDRVIRATKGE